MEGNALTSVIELEAASVRSADLEIVGCGIFTSNCECADNDGCDGDCGGDGSEGC